MSDRPLEDWEDPEPDEADEGDEDTYECPSCGASVYEDCEKCPQCGDYITPRSRSKSAPGGRWMVFAVVLMLAVMVVAVILSR